MLFKRHLKHQYPLGLSRVAQLKHPPSSKALHIQLNEKPFNAESKNEQQHKAALNASKRIEK
ncbi:CLUMA_CG020330, isoform A [Clunio marinus]|uniref:CLUMA_CG020330, isoform A n=1 Tax=Clunio marinus TaxID=568069 RepID=A0A1J1J4M4_9DIPT|nr:CLUMA_CG020330, isoform A [Clunio marinus]